MPEPTHQIMLRLKPSGLQWLDKVAADTGCTRSAVIRQALATARRHETELVSALKEQM